MMDSVLPGQKAEGPEAFLDVVFKRKISPLLGMKQNVPRLNFCHEMGYMLEKLNLRNSW
jgi:hypothetical protein